MIALGSLAEFWVLTETSYRDPLRGMAWVLFLPGHPVFVMGYLAAVDPFAEAIAAMLDEDPKVAATV